MQLPPKKEDAGNSYQHLVCLQKDCKHLQAMSDDSQTIFELMLTSQAKVITKVEINVHKMKEFNYFFK